jgi:putative aldouronate transport system permease protein
MKLTNPKPRFIDLAFDTFIYIFFSAFILMCVFPFYYIFINTISANDLVSKGIVLLLPRGVHLGNYVKILELKSLPNAVFMSVSRTVLGTFLSVFCTAFVAYAVSKKNLWGRKFVYRFFIITMYFNAGLIPWYINMRDLGLDNNFLAYIIAVVSAFNLVLVKTYIESIPESIEESAEIDGAGYVTVFIRLILPLSQPILATVAVFTAVGQWNSFMDTLILMRNPRLYTLQFLLWNYLNQATAIANAMRDMAASGGYFDPSAMLTTSSVRMTIAMVITLPVLCIYPFFQRYFVKGIMIGAIKG